MSALLSAATAGRTIPRLALYAPLFRKPIRDCRVASLEAFIESLRDLNKNDINNNINSGNNKILFSGVEASLAQLGADNIEQKESADLIRSSGLELLVNIDVVNTDGDDGNPENAVVTSSSSSSETSNLVRSFESQLGAISNLGDVVAHINCRGYGTTNSSNNSSNNNNTGNTVQKIPSTYEQPLALQFLLEVLPLSAKFLEDHPHIGRHGNEIDVMGGSPDHLTGISHETTTSGVFRGPDGCSSRTGGLLHHPDIVRELLDIVPPLRLTMDLSSWHGVCGYPWGSDNDNRNDEAEALSVEIVPHIDLIRAARSSLLLSTRNNNYCPNDSSIQRNNNPHRNDDSKNDGENNNAYFRTHQSMWEEVWTRKANRGVQQVYMTLGDDDGDDAIENERTSVERKDDGDVKECPQRRRAKRLGEYANIIRQHYDSWSTKQDTLKIQS